MQNDKIQLVTIFAGYASTGILSAATQRWIAALHSISHRMVMVFDQDQLLNPPACVINDSSTQLLCKKHAAYDFGSYQRGLAFAEQQDWLVDASHVLLTNDSVIGPFGDFESFVGSMLNSGDCLWGVSESYLYRPHLQSYFLLMSRELFTCHAIREFFNSVVVQPSRHDVIQSYELGFSRLVLEEGFSWQVILKAGEMCDPTSGEIVGNITSYPMIMLEKNIPLIKAKALKDYRINQDGLHRTCRLIASHYPEIWSDLCLEKSYHHAWRDLVSVSLILDKKETKNLQERLSWVKKHPHSNLSIVITVEQKDIDLRTFLANSFKQDLQDGTLLLLVTEGETYGQEYLLRLLSFVKADWFVFACSELWSHPGSLQAQLRRVTKDPSQNMINGSPTIWQHDFCFTDTGLKLLSRWYENFCREKIFSKDKLP